MWTYNTDYLAHHGILGQKWGVRRYQNEDGSLTPAGQKRYNVQTAKAEYKNAKKAYKQALKASNKHILAATNYKSFEQQQKEQAAIDKSALDVVNARVNLRAAKKGGTEKALKKAYVKEINKYGLPGSYADTSYGGMGTKLLKDIETKHGKEYAEDVLRRNRNKIITDAAISASIAIGAGVVSALLENN